MTSGVLAQRKEKTHCAHLLLWKKKEGEEEEGGTSCKVVSVRSFVRGGGGGGRAPCVTAHLALSFSLKKLIFLPPLGAKASPLKLKLLPRTSEEMML